ncbi:hypothetical protein K432DRAFT_385008 [Lepidopterella palustris CBS 459.81]|uniref:Uncharacterized protein n=1 Tax=Lepidopterella palustris CBS 459.81 TaxID=1314670 RepID=A0A8E2E445_9PEZI|nr:hypothetical protein K432DRAFT_385008 [Lepidopterella palustris CBS 459.81]
MTSTSSTARPRAFSAPPYFVEPPPPSLRVRRNSAPARLNSEILLEDKIRGHLVAVGLFVPTPLSSSFLLSIHCRVRDPQDLNSAEILVLPHFT